MENLEMNKHTPQPRLTAADFDQDLLDLYDYYAHGKISKREFLDRAGRWAVGGLTAAGISVDPMEKWTAASDEPKEQFSKHTAGSQAGAPASFVPPSFVDEQHVPPGCPTLER